jgi:hypothetical protein
VLQLSYHIARESAAGVQTLPATVFTEILPGDVLIVSGGADAGSMVLNDNPAGGAEQPASGDGKTSPNKDKRADNAARTQRMIEAAAVDPVVNITRRGLMSTPSDNRPY